MPKLILYIVTYLVLIIVQFILPKYIPFVWWIYPNFILMFVVYAGLNNGSMKGQITGFIYGMTWDILSTDIFGIRALTFTISGYLAGRFNKKLNKNQPLTQIIVMGICLIISQCGISIAYVIMPGEFLNTSFDLTHLVWLSILSNLAFTPFIFKFLLSMQNKYNK